MVSTTNNTTSDSYCNIKTSIGKLYLFYIRMKEIWDIEKKLKESKISMDELNPQELLKFYLPYFAYFDSDLVDGNFTRPENYTLKQKDINLLSDNELEYIAKLFIDENIYLTEHIKQKKDEAHVEYFYKLIVAEYKENKKQFEKLSSVFSPVLTDSILQTSRIGNMLKNSFFHKNKIKGISSFFTNSDTEKNSMPIDKQQAPSTIIADFTRKQEEIRLAPYKDISSKIGDMIDIQNKMASFSDGIHKTVVEANIELKNSANSTNKKFEITTGITIVSTIIVAGLSIYSIWFKDDLGKQIKINEKTNIAIDKLNKNIRLTNKIYTEQIKTYNKNIKKLESEIDSLKVKPRNSNRQIKDSKNAIKN